MPAHLFALSTEMLYNIAPPTFQWMLGNLLTTEGIDLGRNKSGYIVRYYETEHVRIEKSFRENGYLYIKLEREGCHFAWSNREKRAWII